MTKLPVALQLYTVRNEMAADFAGTLKKVKAMGYDGVEFAGLFDRDVKEIKSLLNVLELKPVSAHVPFMELKNTPEQVLSVYASLGCKYAAIPSLPDEYRFDKAGYSEGIEIIKALGKTAKEKGMTLLYHNHDFEFIIIEGEYGLDKLYKDVSDKLLETEIDTCWVNVAGVNPVDYVKQYTGRAPVVHLKDFVMKGREKPDHLYELIGVRNGQSVKSEQTEENFGFRPVGYGIQNIHALVEAAIDAGAEWLVVEQDNPGPGKTPLESAEMSVKFLKALK